MELMRLLIVQGGEMICGFSNTWQELCASMMNMADSHWWNLKNFPTSAMLAGI